MQLRCFQQTGKGKADAVWLGFEEAKGDILIILDADLTVRPEDLPRFIEALAIGQAIKADDQVVRRVALAPLPLLAAVGARLYVALDLTVGGWREHRLIILVVDPDGLTTAVHILNDTVNVPVHLIVK